MKPFGIKYQILLITLIPVFLIDLFFTYAHINNSIEQANELLQSKGQIVAHQIAGASEFILFSGDDSQIQYLIDQSVGNNDIVQVSIYNQNGLLIAKSVADEYRSSEASEYYYFRQPILSQNVAFSDIFSPSKDGISAVETIGWVHLNLSRSRLQETTNNIIVDSIVFFITILVLATILTVMISRKISEPIIAMMEHLKNIETGQLGKTIHPIESNEIGELQKGFNRMTQSLLAGRRHLNQRIQQATHQLSEAITDLEAKNHELSFARDEAETENRTKSEYLANMSHEIRTPINGIKGFISLLNQSDLDSTQHRYVGIIKKSTDDLTTIINEILDFSKLESGKLQIVSEEIDLYEVLEQTRDILFINVLTKNIDLNLVIYSDTPRIVLGDKIRLKQILLNLIGNAIKFTDIGQVVIKVSVEDQVDDEVVILISVEDSGIGISEQDQQNLFKAFSQVDSSENRRYTGTGLGLAISKNLATLMNGEISMESTPGKGSRFSLRLPFHLSENDSQLMADNQKDQSALIFSSNNYCLMETQSLFDRAGVNTESYLINNDLGATPIRECIQRNIAYVDLLVFDLRHLNIELDQILDDQLTDSTRIIAMHYDSSIRIKVDANKIELIPIITTSDSLKSHLSNNPMVEESKPVAINSKGKISSKQVLLVDDNQVNLKLGSELIRLWGHQVMEVEHANDALEIYKNRSFDLIILDIQMPDIDGIELLKLMREHNPMDKTPVVALTANILNNEADRLINSGFDYYLSKPIDEEKFRALLDGNPQRKTNIESITVNENSELDCSIDFNQSLALSADNEDILRQILTILLRDIPDYQQQLLKALKLSKRDKISAVTHKLQGVTCYTSLPRLKQILAGFQQLLSRESEPEMDSYVLDITEELGAIKIEIDTYFEKPESNSVL